MQSIYGWIVVFQRVDLSNWPVVFASYQTGFGSIDSNFFLGLNRIYQLTYSTPYRLRVELQLSPSGAWVSAEYWRWSVGSYIGGGSGAWYNTGVTGYNGVAGNYFPTGLYFQGPDNAAAPSTMTAATAAGCAW